MTRPYKKTREVINYTDENLEAKERKKNLEEPFLLILNTTDMQINYII
jgi:hypothetical protein